MVELEPRARLVSALLLLVAALAAQSLTAALVVYGAALVAVVRMGVVRSHSRFVGLAALPLLVALLVLWGWLMPANHPARYSSGVTYALAGWLKIVSCGAVIQALMIPLINQPAELHRFLQETRIPAVLAQVLVTAVIFIPEVGRRLNRLTDARAAQGFPNDILARISSLPRLLSPLVSSLIDTATRRAEFWSHRGVLEPRPIAPRPAVSPLPFLAASTLGLGALVAALTL
jgi:energy-coupling factor transporter transmembrane protein EcfT